MRATNCVVQVRSSLEGQDPLFLREEMPAAAVSAILFDRVSFSCQANPIRAISILKLSLTGMPCSKFRNIFGVGTALCIQAFKRPLYQTQGFKITKTIEDMEGDSEENEFFDYFISSPAIINRNLPRESARSQRPSSSSTAGSLWKIRYWTRPPSKSFFRTESK